MEIKLTLWFVDEWGKPLTSQKPSTEWFLDHHSQESSNQESSGHKYKESYHHPRLSQNTNLQLNLYSNP